MYALTCWKTKFGCLFHIKKNSTCESYLPIIKDTRILKFITVNKVGNITLFNLGEYIKIDDIINFTIKNVDIIHFSKLSCLSVVINFYDNINILKMFRRIFKQIINEFYIRGQNNIYIKCNKDYKNSHNEIWIYADMKLNIEDIYRCLYKNLPRNALVTDARFFNNCLMFNCNECKNEELFIPNYREIIKLRQKCIRLENELKKIEKTKQEEDKKGNTLITDIVMSLVN